MTECFESSSHSFAPFCRYERPNYTFVSYFEEITNSVSRLLGGYFHLSIKIHTEILNLLHTNECTVIL